MMIDVADLDTVGSDLTSPECVLALRTGELFVSDGAGVAHLSPDGEIRRIRPVDPPHDFRANGIALLKNRDLLIANLGDKRFMILRNQFYSEKRRSWRQTQLDQEAAERTLVAVDDPAAPLALDELRRALQALPAEQREALVLVGAGGFAYEEAAEICRCAVGTVKSRVSRARKALQSSLEEGRYDRDGRAAGEAMSAILAEADRLSGPR